MAALNIPLLPAVILMASIATGLTAACIVFVPAGKVKCITEDIRTAAMSVGRYHLTEGLRILGRVFDPNGNIVHLAESVVGGEFAFVAVVSGLYSACFWSPTFQISTAVAVDFQWATGIAAKAWAGVANNGKLEDLEMELKQLVESVIDVKEEMRFLREREVEALRLNEDTNSRMRMLSLLSLIVCLGVAGFQL